MSKKQGKAIGKESEEKEIELDESTQETGAASGSLGPKNQVLSSGKKSTQGKAAKLKEIEALSRQMASAKAALKEEYLTELESQLQSMGEDSDPLKFLGSINGFSKGRLAVESLEGIFPELGDASLFEPDRMDEFQRRRKILLG